MKGKETFQKSCLFCAFGSKLQNEQQLKNYDILPVCNQIERLAFTMTSEMFNGPYLFDVRTHIDFRVFDRTSRTHSMSLVKCNYSLAHQKSVFFRAAKMINFLYRYKIITDLDTMNIQGMEPVFKNQLVESSLWKNGKSEVQFVEFC